jgi:tetratricopeptide (TPR) repeat protein
MRIANLQLGIHYRLSSIRALNLESAGMQNQTFSVETSDSFQAALDMLARGDEKSAELICGKIASGRPDYSCAQHLMGMFAYRRNDFASARRALARAVSENPLNAAYENDLGLVHLALQEHTQAMACFTRAVMLDAALTAAHNNGGLALLAMKQPGEALKWCERALSLDPAFTPALLNLGLAHRDQNNMADARKAFESALAVDPDNVKAHFFLGDLSQSAHDLPEAICRFQEAIRIKPDYLIAHNRLAICLADSDRFDEAIFWMSVAILKAPQSAETFCNYGNILRKARAFRQAVQMYRRAIELKPDWAEAHFNLGLVHLLLGNFEEGWPEFEWRLRQFPPESGYPNRHGLPLWRGESLAKKTILVYDEQGFGDVFLFMRYLRQLKKAGARVVFETRPALISIFKSFPHIDELVERRLSAYPKTACDYCIPLASLPGRLGVRLTTISADTPYLHAAPELKARWVARMAKGAFKIGVVWSGSKTDPKRALDLEMLAPLSELEDICLYGLQKHPEDPAPATPPWIDNLGPELRDFSDTAATIANCDLILTIDTAVAHLAGAMAVPVWVLLPYITDWRWFLERGDSPWYPTMRLFRQQQQGQWTLPVCQVLVALKQLMARKRDPSSAQTTPELNPAVAEVYYRQAQSLQASGRIDEAIAEYGKAISTDPALMAAHYNLGVLHFQQGDWSESANCFRTAFSIAPEFVHAAYNLAAAYDKGNLRSAAIGAYQQTLAIAPGHASAAYNLGLLFFGAGRYADAKAAFRQVIANEPNHCEAHNNLGLTCHHAGCLNEAISCFEEAIRIKPDFAQAYQNLGNVFMDLDQWDQTIACYQKALAVDHHDPSAHYKMGKLYLEVLDLENARSCFENAVALHPNNAEVHYDLAQVLLMQGNFLEGWKHFARRFECAKSQVCIYPFTFNLPLWDGAPYKGRTLLVHCEQGFGDTIQFARFLPLVKALGGKVLFQVQPPLLTLFEDFPGVDQLLALTDQKPDNLEADMVVPLMSLPGCLQIEAARTPNKVPYLHADETNVRRWKTIIDPRTFNVGIVWSGNPIQVNNPRRACKPDDFLPLSTLPGIQLYSLQKEREPSEPAHSFLNGSVIHLGHMLDTFSDTAAVIAHMDLIITVDTSVAHLAGAMGHPVWILLCHLPDWRWGLWRSANTWYPTARLFRQPKRGAWQPVFAMVRDALAELLASNKTVLN